MQKLFALSSKLIFISAALIGTTALAQVHSSASISSTSYQLIDLDLTDGISTDINFADNRAFSFANVLTGTFSDGFSSSANRNSTSNRAIGVSVGDASAGAASSYSGGIFGALASSGQANEQGNYNTFQSFNTSFTLTPKTLLVFFGRISGRAESGLSFAQNSNSSAAISFSGNLLPNGSGFQSSSINDSANSFIFSNSNQFDKQFSLSFINGNAVELTGNFSATTSISGINNDTFPAPIPEPETYAMLLAGLSIMGVMARRRTRNRSA